MDDQTIIEAIIQNKNKTVLKQLYKKSLPLIARYIRSNGGTKADSEDCFQESVTQLIASIKLGKFNTDYTIHGFLFGVARNKWLNELRRNKRYDRTSSLPDPMIEDPVRMVDQEQAVVLEELLSSIGDSCKKLMKLVLYENMRHREVKEVLGMASENAVKSSYYRCKKRLQEKVKKNIGLQKILKGE